MSMKLLVVDDFEFMRLFIKNTLSNLGEENVELACDGKEALELINKANEENEMYTAILCDWNMPVLSGIELLTEIRKDERYLNLPFIMVTAELDVSAVLKAKKAGVSDYLAKPITDKKLERILNNIKQNKYLKAS